MKGLFSHFFKISNLTTKIWLMTQLKQIYKCEICGNIVEVLHAGAGELVCCGQPMALMEEKKEDEGQEKHVPVIERVNGTVRVKVGSTVHPMDEDHYIEWVEIVAGGKSCRKVLKAGEAPEAEFETSAEKVEARAYCNIHGLWRAQ